MTPVRVAYGYGIEDVLARAHLPANTPRHDLRVIEAVEKQIALNSAVCKAHFLQIKTLDGNVYRIEDSDIGDENVVEPSYYTWIEVKS